MRGDDSSVPCSPSLKVALLPWGKGSSGKPLKRLEVMGKERRGKKQMYLVSGSWCLWHFQSKVLKLLVAPRVGGRSKGTSGTGGEKGKGRGRGLEEVSRSF